MDNEKLKIALAKVWHKKDGQPDDAMISHCIKSHKYVEIDGMFIICCDKKPTINSEMWYDDEQESPGKSWEVFSSYNNSNCPELRKLCERWGDLYLISNYWGYDSLELASLAYYSEEDVKPNYRKVTEKELVIINQAIQEVIDDYQKRLKTYYKKYNKNIYSSGYWVNR